MSPAQRTPRPRVSAAPVSLPRGVISIASAPQRTIRSGLLAGQELPARPADGGLAAAQGPIWADASLSDASKMSVYRDDFPRVHDVVWVKRLLDRAHGGERSGAVLGLQIRHLALADAVLTGRSALHG